MTGYSSHPLLARSDDDGRVLWLALGVAVALHLAVLLFVVLPEFDPPVAPKEASSPLNITVVHPPPPPIERPPQRNRDIPERILPVPDPVPERPEPVREPERREIDFVPPEDLPYVVGDPQEPPAMEPFALTTAEIVPPELIQGSKVEPEFPELARAVRFSGRVTLRAVIDENGSVVEIEVIDCNRPGLGFDDAAIEAVRQWEYKPATLRGRPVPVYLLVQVEFKLH